jgi:hypothetical protein
MEVDLVRATAANGDLGCVCFEECGGSLSSYSLFFYLVREMK